MGKKKISCLIKEVENISTQTLPEEEWIASPLVLPSYVKSYSQTRIESTTFDYTWEIDQFIHLSRIVDMLYSPLFSELADYRIQMNISRKADSLLKEREIQFYIHTNKTLIGLCTTTIMLPRGTVLLTRSISGCLSNMTLLIEFTDSLFKSYSSIDPFIIHCNFEIFHELASNTMHMNLLPPSTFSKDVRSLKDLTLDDSESEGKKSIKFIIGGEQYVVPKKLLRATNSSYFKLSSLDERKEIDMTEELIKNNDLEIFKHILLFIITGSIKSYDYNILQKLLIAADNYDVPDLKLMCEHYLLRYITIENAVELIQLAFSSYAKFLEAHAAGFIKYHIKEIMCTEEFRNLPHENSDKIIELIEKNETSEIFTYKSISFSSSTNEIVALPLANEKVASADT